MYVWQISFDVQLQFQSVMWRFQNKNKNVNWHIYFISKCHLNFGLHNILEKTHILICDKIKLSIELKYPLVSHVSPNVEDGSPIYCIHLKPTKRDMHKSIKGLQVQPIMQVALDYILFGKSSLTNSYTWWNGCNVFFFCQSCIRFRPICVSFQIATTYAPSLKYCFVLTLMSKCFCKF